MAKKRRYSSEEDPTRDRILKAALECISRTSVRELSVRAIAARAEVNVATVHYYFRTKDAVLTEALGIFFTPIKELFTAAFAAEGPPQERLVALLTRYMDIVYGNPGVFISIIEAMAASNIRKEPNAPSTCEDMILSVIGMFQRPLQALVRKVSGLEDPTLLAYKTLQVMTSVVHPMLISTIPQSQFGLNFSQESSRKRYIELLVEGLAGMDRGGKSASKGKKEQ